MHEVAFLNLVGRTQQDSTNVVFLKVHHNGPHAVVELQKFVCLGISQTVDAHHAVIDLQDSSHFRVLSRQVYVLQLGQQYL